MTDKITENTIENFCIKLLEKQGYEYIYAPDIAPDSDNPLRNSFEEVILPNRFKLNHYQRQTIDKQHHIRAFIHAVFNHG
jgi:hypothetical protein